MIRKYIGNLSGWFVSSSTKQEAASALGTLAAKSHSNIIEITEAGGIEALMGLLRDSNITTRQKGIDALVPLSSPDVRMTSANSDGTSAITATNNNYEKNRTAIARAIELFVNLLRDTDTDIKRSAAGILRRLAYNHVGNQMAIVRAGGIEHLVRLLSDDDMVVIKNAAATLVHLAGNSTYQVLIIDSNAVEILEQLQKDLSTEDEDEGDYDPFKASDKKNARRESCQLTEKVDVYLRYDTGASSLICTFDNILLTAFTGGYGRDLLQINRSFLTSRGEIKDVHRDAVTIVTAAARSILQSCEPILDQRKQAARAASAPALERPPLAVPLKKAAESAPARPPIPPAADTIPELSDLRVSSHLTVISSRELELLRVIGQGGFGTVWEALWNGSTQVAAKQLKGQLTSELLAEFRAETEIHAGLRHPNIIALFGVCLESMKYAMIIEFMANGSLFNVLSNPTELPWSLRLTIALDAVSGLLYLHGRQIIHRDLKSLNILVDGQMRAKIADFGLAKIKRTSNSSTPGMGTPLWMAPELFDGGCCNKTTDIYAMGIVFWEIATRKLPYAYKDPIPMARYVERGGRETIPSETPPKYSALITRCWAQRSEERPSIEEVAREIREINSAGTPADAGYRSIPGVKEAAISPGYQHFS